MNHIIDKTINLCYNHNNKKNKKVVDRFMSKLYNTQAQITTEISKFLKKSIPNIRKTQLNIIPSIIFGMINSNSCSASCIASSLKDDFSKVQFDSVTKRIRRLFNNKYFDPYHFYASFIKTVISTYKKKHNDKRVHICFDHSYSHENYTIYMISMRIGKQGIPIYFECFKGINNPDSYLDETIIKGIDFVSNLFKDTDLELIFLADRWFNSEKVLKHIDNLNHCYCIRIKNSLKVKIFDKKEKHYINKFVSQLFAYQCHSTFYSNVYLYKNALYKTNLVISKKQNVDEPWIIATNGDRKRAIKDYSYRFGGIETIFKHQKSNGFYLEKINNSSLKAFTSMFSLLCFSITWLIIIGCDYTKNSKCYKNSVIETHKKGKRVISLFKTGMLLFKRAFNSKVYIRLPFSFILYDS